MEYRPTPFITNYYPVVRRHTSPLQAKVALWGHMKAYTKLGSTMPKRSCGCQVESMNDPKP